MKASEFQTENINVEGNGEATIIVLTDAPSTGVFQHGECINSRSRELFMGVAKDSGIEEKEFAFVCPSPPIPESEASSDGKVGKFLANYRDEVFEVLKQFKKVRVVVVLGKTAARQYLGRPCKITELRGKVAKGVGRVPMFAMLSPSNVLARPEVRDTFVADFGMLASFKEAGWDQGNMVRAEDNAKFRLVTDLQFLLDNPPKAIAVDTETDGLRYAEGNTPLLATLCWNEEEAIAVPLDCDYYPKLTNEVREKLIRQLKELLANPNVAVVGHNYKFDLHMLKTLGVETANWYADTLQLAFSADDNMQSKSLSDCVKRWLPTMSGYSDVFESEVDYAKMREVPHDKMLAYACGDALATFMLAKKLIAMVKEDDRQWKTFLKVQMPALRTFAEMEHVGMRLDTDKLAALEVRLGEMETDLKAKLLRGAPAAVKRKHIDKGLEFSRDDFVRDILFSDEGFGLTPRVFTKGTAKAARASERVPSTSAKDHLPYFLDTPWVIDLIAYKKLEKMRSTYVGSSSKYEYRQLKVLKNGKLPAKIENQLEERGYRLEAGKVWKDGEVVRARRRALEIEGEDTEIRYRIHLPDSVVNVTNDRELWEERQTEPTGFWQYLQNGEFIHASFVLHATVTGRCVTGDALVITDKGVLRLDELVTRVKDGEKFQVFTHKGKWGKVTDSWENGEKPVVEITTASGKKVKVTPEHKLWTKTDSDVDPCWRAACDVKALMLKGIKVAIGSVKE